ncbi:MAG: hypothetical protein NPIRA01_01950 [Nitrospirales bacterium]|nr:MAG: hypothetical protein NPIRA01_01950 [Nitrospirales bacterium]
MMDTWCFKFYHWNRNDQPRREALCTVGNGYFATRDAAEESFPGECHYPGTYLAGHYNQLASVIAHHEVIHEDMVNWPN